jgi:hypothetical protein
MTTTFILTLLLNTQASPPTKPPFTPPRLLPCKTCFQPATNASRPVPNRPGRGPHK